MVKSNNDLMENVKALFGDRNDDEVISFYEDLSDTLNSKEDVEKIRSEYETKLKEQDKIWRDKYTERFFSENGDINDNDINRENTEDNEPILKTKYEELFI